MPCLLLPTAALSLAACDVADTPVKEDRPGFSADGRRDLIGLDVPIDGDRHGLTYIQFGSERDVRGNGRAFADYGCKDTCADLRAGYELARATNISLARQCTGDTWGKLEGCVAFTQGLEPLETELPPIGEE